MHVGANNRTRRRRSGSREKRRRGVKFDGPSRSKSKSDTEKPNDQLVSLVEVSCTPCDVDITAKSEPTEKVDDADQTKDDSTKEEQSKTEENQNEIDETSHGIVEGEPDILVQETETLEDGEMEDVELAESGELEVAESGEMEDVEVAESGELEDVELAESGELEESEEEPEVKKDSPYVETAEWDAVVEQGEVIDTPAADSEPDVPTDMEQMNKAAAHEEVGQQAMDVETRG